MVYIDQRRERATDTSLRIPDTDIRTEIEISRRNEERMKVERIARKAEAAQRLAKRGKWV